MGAELLHPTRHTRRTPSRKSSRKLRRHHAPIYTSLPIRELYAGSGFASSAPAPSELPMPRLIYPDRIGSLAMHLITDDSVLAAFGGFSEWKAEAGEMELKASDCEFQERGNAIMEIWGRKEQKGCGFLIKCREIKEMINL